MRRDRMVREFVLSPPIDVGLLDGVEEWLRTRRVAAGKLVTRRRSRRSE